MAKSLGNYFKPVDQHQDFIALENELLEKWYKNGIVDKYLHKNDNHKKRFSFLDGPITANNPMAVHHGWGRTYKDLWQRWYNMQGFTQRFQNGFDEQGLWVEVEVEKELGLKTKKDIENLVPGDSFASLEKFINLCKDRVKKYSEVQTVQSKRLGYFMDWKHSYHTSSSENNYMIWKFLKTIHEQGWLYKGHDSVPWCPRCGTAISQHEILTEQYQEIQHTAIYVLLPITTKGWQGVNLLVWTTTPWTIPANTGVAVDKKLVYEIWGSKDKKIIVGQRSDNKKLLDGFTKEKEIKGENLVGLSYKAPFDQLPEVKKAISKRPHKVIATNPLVLPISLEEGTGLVHMAPGAGSEDFALGKTENLAVISPIDESAVYVSGFNWLTGLSTKEATSKIVEYLDKQGFLFKRENYRHRYPTCWRCKHELVWRVVDEWYIAMDKLSPGHLGGKRPRTYREMMINITKKINWLPVWGRERELDWLANMHDWLISKKRYWGLSLPIWECKKCGNFEVIGSREELEEKACSGWEAFDGHSPHRPWVDQVKILCSKCGEAIARIPDVGNPWLDAGIVPFSTISKDNRETPLYKTDRRQWEKWFPVDFITESFPGQFKNWFYVLIAMSTALEDKNPFKNILGYGSVRDEKGKEMHKSAGNAIEFNEAADKIGVDVMRWMYTSQNPELNLEFGYKAANEVRRRFYLIYWNSYKYFIEYATLFSWSPKKADYTNLTILDNWILARLAEVILEVNRFLGKYDAAGASSTIEKFIVEDFSTWYIRRSRDRVSPVGDGKDRNAFLSVSYKVLETLARLTSPFMPFISEDIFLNLTKKDSVHLSDYPHAEKPILNTELVKKMDIIRKTASLAHAKRKEANIPVRQPLRKLIVASPYKKPDKEIVKILEDELNVKKVEWEVSKKTEVFLDIKITHELKEEGMARDLARKIQEERKKLGLTLLENVDVISPWVPENLRLSDWIKSKTLIRRLKKGKYLRVEKVNL